MRRRRAALAIAALTLLGVGLSGTTGLSAVTADRPTTITVAEQHALVGVQLEADDEVTATLTNSFDFEVNATVSTAADRRSVFIESSDDREVTVGCPDDGPTQVAIDVVPREGDHVDVSIERSVTCETDELESEAIEAADDGDDGEGDDEDASDEEDDSDDRWDD